MKSNRRGFLTGLGAAAAAGCCGIRASGTETRYALQLFSIHKIFKTSPEACLAEIKAAGYDGVEFAGFGGRTAAQVRKCLADAGLTGAGAHVNGDTELRGDALTRTLEFCAEAGLESVTTPHALRKTADEYRRFGHEMGLAAEAAARYGLHVGIHTTYRHFTVTFGSETAWDMIFKEASPRLQQQIDTGNVFHTGTDVTALLKKYRGRHHSLHAKENVPTVDGVLGVPPTDGGACVPWRDVLAFAKTDPGFKWWIVEAEGRPDSLDPARECLRRLTRWNSEIA